MKLLIRLNRQIDLIIFYSLKFKEEIVDMLSRK